MPIVFSGIVATVIVQPKYPNDPTPEVAADFAATLREVFPEDDVRIVTEAPHAHQVTFYEVFSVWIPGAGTVMGIIQAALAIRRWMKSRHVQDNGVRPRTVTLYGANGQPLKEITILPGLNSEPTEIDLQISDGFRLPPKP